MSAIAISNNDIVYLHWHFEKKLPNCLGYSVIRYDAHGKGGTALPAMVGFPSDKPAGKKFEDTNKWPVQKFAWKDLYAKRGGTYWYEIVPMMGKPGNLKPDPTRTLRTNTVTLSSKRGDCSVFFNRGIISTQAIARNLPKNKGGIPSTAALQAAIKKPESLLRRRLAGDLENGVLMLLDRTVAAIKDGKKAACYCALYELSDSDLIERLKVLGKSLHLVLSNAGEDTENGSGDGDSTNQATRNELHSLKLDVTDRMLTKGHIGHNKFVVYVENGKAQAVLAGSTNWTATGLCAQSNNSIVIESPRLANDYLTYWRRLKQDTKDAGDNSPALQGKDFRSADKTENDFYPLKDDAGNPSGDVHVWFSPNTTQKTVPRPKKETKNPKPIPIPPDLAELFELIERAKQGVLFLAFIPGNPSVVTKLKEVYNTKRNAHELFYLRGAATSPDPAGTFRVDLYHRSATSDATVRPVNAKDGLASANVASVAGIFASFAEWEAEIYKLGHAVIHDKILVIDPFTEDSVIVTGSHNLGFKASYSNDENLVVIRNNRAVAEAYAAHVLDVYEHYRWRWQIQAPLRAAVEKLKAANPKMKAGDAWRQVLAEQGPKLTDKAWHNLIPDDTWQDFYVKYRDFLAAEENFWSAFEGVGKADRRPIDPALGHTS